MTTHGNLDDLSMKKHLTERKALSTRMRKNVFPLKNTTEYQGTSDNTNKSESIKTKRNSLFPKMRHQEKLACT